MIGERLKVRSLEESNKRTNENSMITDLTLGIALRYVPITCPASLQLNFFESVEP